MAETTQDTSMTISEKREAIMDLTGVSAMYQIKKVKVKIRA
jgi:hypothetical protein